MLGTLTMELTIDTFSFTSNNKTEHHFYDRERLCNWFCLVSLALFGTVWVPPACCLAPRCRMSLVGLTMKSCEESGDVQVKECISSRGLVHEWSGDAP